MLIIKQTGVVVDMVDMVGSMEKDMVVVVVVVGDMGLPIVITMVP